jgi:hypothetical protein
MKRLQMTFGHEDVSKLDLSVRFVFFSHFASDSSVLEFSCYLHSRSGCIRGRDALDEADGQGAQGTKESKKWKNARVVAREYGPSAGVRGKPASLCSSSKDFMRYSFITVPNALG